MIPQDFLDELLSRVDIVEIIEPRVQLKKTGKDFTGLCPFHDEKTPSFSVSQDKQFYYCFGCQASGTALDFLMAMEQLDFIQAVETLAARVGMEVPRQNQDTAARESDFRKTLFETLDKVGAYYRDQLRNHEQRERAVTYLKGRGLSGAIARDYGVGYAPAGWDNLETALAINPGDKNLLLQSGMLTEKSEEDKTFDRFRDRVMFPIRDLRGRTIAFGGRIIGDDKPKYLNSPETPVFHKGYELYGLFEARRRTRNLQQIIVVEGYMDVIALAQHNINYAVATLGTATSSNHIERLYRLVSKIIFCFDGDTAGRNAAWKALDIVLEFLEDGRSAAFLFLPDGEDPDTLVRKDGRDRFEQRLNNATSFKDFCFSNLEASLDMDTPEGKAALSKSVMPMINRIPEGVFKHLMIDELSARTGLAPDRLLTASSQYARNRHRDAPVRSYSPPALPPQRTGEQDSAQIELAVSMLLQQPELAQSFVSGDYAGLAHDQDCKLLIQLMELILQRDNISPAELPAAYQETHTGTEHQVDYLKSLAARKHLLDVSQFQDEFTGILRSRLARVDKRLGKQNLQPVLKKPFSELSESERAQIRDHHRKNL